MIHVTNKHSTCHPGKIICFTITIEVLLRTVITVTINMLHRTVNRKLLFVLVKELVVTQSAAINNMLSLLGNIGFVRLIVELITSATKLIGCVILQVDAA